MKRQYLLFVISAILVAIVFLSLLLWPQNKINPTPLPSASPASLQKEYSPQPIINFNPPETNKLQYFTQDQGGGINLDSVEVKDSQKEIAKLSPNLPYQETYTLSKGQRTEVIIPKTELQSNPWILNIQIFDINYQLAEDDPKYLQNKTSFIEASNKVFKWIQSRGVDPNKIIISWGDKDFIQKQAEQWIHQK